VEEGLKPRDSSVDRSGHVGDVGPKSGSRSCANQIWNDSRDGRNLVCDVEALCSEEQRNYGNKWKHQQHFSAGECPWHRGRRRWVK